MTTSLSVQSDSIVIKLLGDYYQQLLICYYFTTKVPLHSCSGSISLPVSGNQVLLFYCSAEHLHSYGTCNTQSEHKYYLTATCYSAIWQHWVLSDEPRDLRFGAWLELSATIKMKHTSRTVAIQNRISRTSWFQCCTDFSNLCNLEFPSSDGNSRGQKPIIEQESVLDLYLNEIRCLKSMQQLKHDLFGTML